MGISASSSALTVAFLTPEYVTEEKFHGGLANYVRRAAAALSALGHNVHVVVSSTVRESVVIDGIQVHKIPVWHGESWVCKGRVFTLANKLTRGKYTMLLCLLRQSFILNRAVKKLHKRYVFDVVQYPQLGGVGYFRSKRIPSVVRLSSLASLWNAHGGFGESDREMRQQEYMELSSLKKADAVFGPSVQIAKHVEKIIGKPVQVIESPYENDVRTPDASLYDELFSEKSYLLFFGSVGHIKGVSTIANCIHELLSRHPQLCFGFVGKRLAGQDGGDVMEQVWQQAGEHKDRVLWHDAVRHAQLYPIIEHAHTVVLPSRIDNFPNACIEAMAHGKVVIGTKGNGFEQLIEHGKSGLLCQADDPEDLLRTIELALLFTPAEQQEIGRAARQRVRELSPQKIGKQLVTLYRSVCQA